MKKNYLTHSNKENLTNEKRLSVNDEAYNMFNVLQYDMTIKTRAYYQTYCIATMRVKQSLNLVR